MKNQQNLFPMSRWPTLEISGFSYLHQVWAHYPMDRCQILSWTRSGRQNSMKQAKFVAFEQIVIMSLMKNLLWNVSHGSIEILFCKNCGQSNVFSLYWIQFLSKRTKKVKLRKSFSHVYASQHWEIEKFLLLPDNSLNGPLRGSACLRCPSRLGVFINGSLRDTQVGLDYLGFHFDFCGQNYLHANVTWPTN